MTYIINQSTVTDKYCVMCMYYYYVSRSKRSSRHFSIVVYRVPSFTCITCGRSCR